MSIFMNTRTLPFIGAAALAITGTAAAQPYYHASLNRPPDATVILATPGGVDLMQGQWRYSDTEIVEVDFRRAGPEGQPTGKPVKTYDYIPHAGGADFDDTAE